MLQYIFIESGGYLSRDNLVSMKNLNGFCGDSGVKFNLFLIYYSRYEKEKNWMSDGQKLVLSLHTLPPKAQWAYIIEIEQDGRLPPPSPPQRMVTLNQLTGNLWGGCQSP